MVNYFNVKMFIFLSTTPVFGYVYTYITYEYVYLYIMSMHTVCTLKGICMYIMDEFLISKGTHEK